MSNIGRGSNNY